MRGKIIRRFGLFGLLVAAIFLVPIGRVVVNRMLERRAEARELAAEIDALDSADPDWRLDRVGLAHNDAIPADRSKNATVMGFTALGLRPPAWKDRQTAIYAVADPLPDIVNDDDRLPSDAAICSLLEVHFQSADANAAALSTLTMPAGGVLFSPNDPDPFGTLIPHVQQCREVASLLNDTAVAEAYRGESDAAMRAAETILHYARVSLGTEPWLISRLVHVAMNSIAAGAAQRALAWGEADAALAPAQQAFTRAAEFDGLTLSLRGERAAFMRVYDNVRSGALPSNYFETGVFAKTSNSITPLELVQKQLGGTDLTHRQLVSLRAYTAYLEACKLSGPARRAAFAAVMVHDERMADYLPVLDKMAAADDRGRARMVCAAVGIACERYRRETGHWPAALTDIPPAILPAVPTDPFNGKPIGYVVLPDGAAVYTAGPDGTFTGVPDPMSALQLTYAFRLWNPEARRRPALPEPEIEVTDPDAFDPDAP